MGMAVCAQSAEWPFRTVDNGYRRHFPKQPELPLDGRIYYEYHGETIWHFVPFSGWCIDTARVVNRETLAYDNPYTGTWPAGGTPVAERYPERLFYRVEEGWLKTGFESDSTGFWFGKQPLSTVYYQDGLMQGDACFYHSPDQRYAYKNQPVVLKASGRFEKGYRCGEWLYYSENGSIQESRDYGSGSAWPLRRVYYRKWGYTMYVWFLTESVVRESHTYNASGERTSTELLTDHTQNAGGQDSWLYEVKNFYPGGQLRSSRMEWRGPWGAKRTGTEAYFDENGTLIRSVVHE